MENEKQYVSKKEHILGLIKKKRKLSHEDVRDIQAQAGVSYQYVRKVFRDKQAEREGRRNAPKLIGKGKSFRKEVGDTYSYLCKQTDEDITWDEFLASPDYKALRYKYSEYLSKTTLNIYTGQVYKEIFFENPQTTRGITEKQVNTIIHHLRLVGYLTHGKEQEVRTAIEQAELRAYEGIQLIAFLKRLYHLTKVADSRFGHYVILPLLAGVDRIKLFSKVESKRG